MINNLDEAIKHCEEKANENKAEATKIAREKKPFLEYARCKQCAKEHEQLAEWLKELKAYKERPQGELAEKLKERIEESVCKHCQKNKKCELCEISRVYQIITLTTEEQKGGAE